MSPAKNALLVTVATPPGATTQLVATVFQMLFELPVQRRSKFVPERVTKSDVVLLLKR